MYKDVARAIDGIGLYPAISILIFFAVFVLALSVAWSARKKQVSDWAAIPLEDGSTDITEDTTDPLTVNSPLK